MRMDAKTEMSIFFDFMAQKLVTKGDWRIKDVRSLLKVFKKHVGELETMLKGLRGVPPCRFIRPYDRYMKRMRELHPVSILQSGVIVNKAAEAAITLMMISDVCGALGKRSSLRAGVPLPDSQHTADVSHTPSGDEEELQDLGVENVAVHRASPVPGYSSVGTTISMTKPFPRDRVSSHLNKTIFETDAAIIKYALSTSLPGGTIDQLLVALLKDRASELVVTSLSVRRKTPKRPGIRKKK